jgi:hypothetical protein
MTQIPIIKFICPHDCIICGKKEESNDHMYRMDLNEFFPEQLAKLPGKFLGQLCPQGPRMLE